MKIKKLIKLLECIEGDYNGKLPQDMYRLGTYTKEGGTWEAIAEMDLVHVMRACKRVIKYDVNLEELEQARSTIDALIRENRRKIQENYELRHPRYVFSEIPNDCDGQRFIDDVKKYFNKGTYRMRVRGQHVKEEYKGTGVTTHRQNIEQSTHLRVYIEEK